jgi:hypothetical protein
MLDEELQRRAIAIAIGQPGALEGSLDDTWDQLWLGLGEELGWSSVAMLDAVALREELAWAVESERLRRAGWSEERIEGRESQQRLEELVAQSRLPPGEAFDVSHWVGPLLNETAREHLERVQHDWGRQQTGGRHPADYVSVFEFDTRWMHDTPASPDKIEAELVALGATATCRVVRLHSGDADFEPGSRVPLRPALDIAFGMVDRADLILVCLAGRLGYVTTHERWHSIVYRPS